jgi:hypothetical protein
MAPSCTVEESRPSLHCDGKVYRVWLTISTIREGMFYTSVNHIRFAIQNFSN